MDGARGKRKLGRGPVSVRAKLGAEKASAPYVDEASVLAANFIAEAKTRFGTELGFDIDHVRRLDRLLTGESAAFDDGLILAAGFYFGEVLRRAYKGRYQWQALQGALGLEVFGVTTLPIEKVRKVAKGEDKLSLEAHVMVLAKKALDQKRSARQERARD